MVNIQRSNQDFIVKLRHPRLDAVAVVVPGDRDVRPSCN